jgi:RHS repeat-associated protein
VTYEYDVASRMTRIIYPDSMQILYAYDDLSRITEIKRYVDGQNDEILFDDPQYDVESLLTQFNYGNEIQATYTYDSRDRALTIDVKDGVTSLLDLDYTYDNISNITQLINGWRDTSSTWHSETESYSYDGLDRLTSASCTSWSHTYTFDKAGNRTGKDSITYTINSVNEVTALSDNTTFTYDDNGNRTQKAKGDDIWDYTYDYVNRLTEIEENESTIGEYVYDGDGKRLQKTENSITTTYIYSGINTFYEENPSGSACYVYGPTGLMAKRTTINQESITYYYHKDHLGSTRSVTDSSKNIITASTYHPFGETDIEEGSEQYLYNGKEKDITGLYYYGARYYDPEIGRFITRDILKGSLSSPQSLNRNVYCLNNPQKYKDPNGFYPKVTNVTGKEYFWYGIAVDIAVGSILGYLGYVWGGSKTAALLCATLGAIGAHNASTVYESVLNNNFSATVSHGEISIEASGNTPKIDMYVASIVIEEDDPGSYKGRITNASNTELLVVIENKGEGTLHLLVENGLCDDEKGQISIAILGGNVNLYIDEGVEDLWIKLEPGTNLTLYLPMGYDGNLKILIPRTSGCYCYITVYYPTDSSAEEEYEEQTENI